MQTQSNSLAKRRSFSFMLPLFSLILFARFIAGPIAISYAKLQIQAHGAPTLSVSVPIGEMDLPRASFLSFAADSWGARFGHLIFALNMPAIIVEIPIDRFTSAWPSTWTPHGIRFESWRACSYPIYCLPFWWIAGVGIDTASQRRRLRWFWLMGGTLAWAFIIFIAMGLTFGVPSEDHVGMAYVFWGFALWTGLFTAYPVAWFQLWRQLRRPRPDSELAPGR